MPYRLRRIAASVFVTALWLSVPPLAAQTTASLNGLVVDSSGGYVPGVEVIAFNVETGLKRYAVSDDDGHYSFPALPPGGYQIRAELEGFRPAVREGIVLRVGQAAVAHLVLEVGALEAEEIVVVADANPVQTGTSDASYLVDEKTLTQLPLNGRNYTDLALLQPGVLAFRNRDSFGSVVAHGLGVAMAGRDYRSNVYLLDGTPQNDFTNGPAGSAANTVLGLETIREFQVATNNYSAEYGRNSGGQINVITKSGTNLVHGSAYYFHRNDNVDARNFFDPGDAPPEFRRHQYGATVGGPLKTDRWFYFLGYEGLRSAKGKSLTTVVPDDNARLGFLPDPENPGALINVGVAPDVAPYLREYPVANGGNQGGGLALHNFEFQEVVNQDFFQARIDRSSERGQFFSRYTFDDARMRLPTDYPQFPRDFLSRNQFLTLEYRNVFSNQTVGVFRGSFSRTNVGQDVEANTTNPLPPFVATRRLVGNIDIGGMPRFGPQTSVDVSLVQNVFGFEGSLARIQGLHSLKLGVLTERYQDNMVNPTFSLGIYSFAGLREFLEDRPLRFLGLGPEGELDRYWRFSLFGFYLQDDYRPHHRLVLNLGLRYEFATVPDEIYGRNVALLDLGDPEPAVGKLYENPTLKNLSPRLGLAWDVFGDGTLAVRSGYGLYYNTNNQQNLIVTVTNPPFTPRFLIPSPTFPDPPFERGIGNSLRPIEYRLKSPAVQVWHLNLQKRLWPDTFLTVGYSGSRGTHLLRSGDVNIPEPQRQSDGSLFWPVTATRPNSNFGTIELKTSDGDSWYHAMILELRKRWSYGFSAQSSYTFSRSIDTTQASTFFSDASNGTTSAMPDFGTDYNKGLSDFHAKHNLSVNFIWQIPLAAQLQGWRKSLLNGWQLAGFLNLQSGNPLTVFVASNRSRSRWSPSILPGLGFDRPSLAPGFTHESAVTGDPNRYFNPAAFELQEAGRLGNLGRGTFTGPDLKSFDLQAAKSFQLPGESSNLQVRLEAFNLFNRANFAAPTLQAFSGTQSSPLTTLGQVRSTNTDPRQIQLGLRLSW